jgi:hypothetical protein
LANIKTLVKDIYRVLEEGVKALPQGAPEAFGSQLAGLIIDRLTRRDDPPRLRMSNLGTTCNRKLWYTVNTPELAEKLPGHVRMKFLIGDIIEHVTLFLAEVAGHKVTGKQSELELDGVRGSRDAVIDGVLVDVKSASSYSYTKFANGLKPGEDSFGYLEQLGAYREASQAEQAAFVAIDKSLGCITVDMHGGDLDRDWGKLISEKKAAIAQSKPPERGYHDQPDGKSGNRRLCTECSYCPFKHTCWPGLRVFAYSGSPRYLSYVSRLPDVPEIGA